MSISRRAILQGGAAATAAILAGGSRAVAAAPASRPANELEAYTFSAQVWVKRGGRTLTCYRAHPTQKYPYFYPIAAPATGLSMTAESGSPFPHHRSLFIACDRVNGGNYWQDTLERGQIISHGPTAEVKGADIVIVDACDWRRPGQTPVLEDRRRWTIRTGDPKRLVIDADITLEARTDIRVERTNHSLFALRASVDLTPLEGGLLLNSTGGRSEKGTFGFAAAWCGYQNTRLGKTESLVMIDHPANPWSPCRWFTRDYGFISPTPMNWLDKWELPKGQSVRLRYRVIAQEGPIEKEEMERAASTFSA